MAPRLMSLLYSMAVLVGYLDPVSGESWMVHLQQDGVARSNSGLTWRQTLPTLTTFTFCIRLYSFRSRYSDYVFSYAVQDNDNELTFHLKFKKQELRLACCSMRIFHIVPVRVGLLRWFSFCAAVDLPTYIATFAHDASIVRTTLVDSLQEPDTPLKVAAGGNVILGQDQDNVAGGTDKGQSFNGLMVDLYLIESLLTEEEMKDYLSCRTDALLARPHLMSFENIREDFTLGMETNVTTAVDTCSPGSNKLFSVFAEGRSQEKSRHFCSTLNGDIATPNNVHENVALSLVGSRLADKCTEYDKDNSMWIGVYWDPENQQWQDQKTRTKAVYKNFELEVIPSSESILCAGASMTEFSGDTHKGNWGIDTCGRELCTACQFEYPEPMKMRGLCDESLFDREYYIYDTVNQRPVFNGNRWSKMVWSVKNYTTQQTYYWLLYLIGDPSIQARMVTPSVLMYPIGVHEFEISGDKCTGKRHRLKLTSCRQNMFTCGDGMCIDLSKRCNLELDCDDHTDELNCETLVKPPGYEKRLPPPKVNSSTPAIVNITCDIRLIRKLDLLDSQLIMDVVFKRSWYDSRLRYKNLHADNNLNQIDDLMNRAWYPDVTILGTDNSQVNAQPRRTAAWGERTAGPLPDNYQLIDEDVFYSGAANPLVLQREMTFDLMCTFDLTLYPFDTQRCTMTLYVGAYTRHYVLTSLHNVTFSGTRRLLEYRVTGVRHTPLEYQDKSGQLIEIVLANLYGYYISSAYVPTMLLVIISYLTFFFSLDDFTNRVMVSLTSLLVLAALFSQIASGLPKTAYLKLIDVWFIFCILSDFVMVTVLVFINSYMLVHKPITTCVLPLSSRKRTKVKWCQTPKLERRHLLNPRQVNSLAQVLLPVLMGLFIFIYFACIAFFMGTVQDEFET
ncbi:uncharacterized protein [Panulirus ornatus]|uniref:uncharacterized protein n=1 Tax=Panulirus ornatus TaxID=150431 RepID=UPI003A89EE99